MPPDAEVQFSSDLYVMAAVTESARAFGELAKVSITVPAPDSGTIIVRFADIQPDVADAIADEFCNHVLAGTIEHRRLAAV
jgi:hypothetical protein